MKTEELRLDPCAAGQIILDLGRRRSKPPHHWNLEEVYLKIDGGPVTLLKKYGFVPDKLVTDDLRSYAAAASDLGIANCHERGRWHNNRAEHSHQPTATDAATYNTFNVQPHLTSARTHWAFRASAMNTWRAVVAVA